MREHLRFAEIAFPFLTARFYIIVVAVRASIGNLVVVVWICARIWRERSFSLPERLDVSMVSDEKLGLLAHVERYGLTFFKLGSRLCSLEP